MSEGGFRYSQCPACGYTGFKLIQNIYEPRWTGKLVNCVKCGCEFVVGMKKDDGTPILTNKARYRSDD